ncbi:hypothetical protein [Nocardioides hwasunensis]|uniref:Uncharacterized protein n=1 Tax=Nocardioides hwasunensis TaxID=397258 RepID=A0ABR8MGC2_9ACTN|nr:hypothetical protein [Nocardioides hwasunensis]MBD3915008.1 hypothetical protein [Nocardioides hwasunensis]
MTTAAQASLNPWLKASVPALVVALAVGAGAAAVRTDAPAGVVFAVFASLTFPFALALGAVLLDRTEHPEEHEDSIERQWTTRASSGAFFDTVVAMGLTVFATSVLDTRGAPLWLFVILALGDFAVRLAVIRRREA